MPSPRSLLREVLVVDEIGTEMEALAARTLGERGVQLLEPRRATRTDNASEGVFGRPPTAYSELSVKEAGKTVKTHSESHALCLPEFCSTKPWSSSKIAVVMVIVTGTKWLQLPFVAKKWKGKFSCCYVAEQSNRDL